MSPQPEPELPFEGVTHIIIARACRTDPEGSHVQVKRTVRCFPGPSKREIDAAAELAAAAFRQGFGDEPSRVGVGVLPFVAELDQPEDD